MMKSLQLLQQEFAGIESGVPRLNAIRQAFQEADQEQDLYMQFQLRFFYIKESIFCGDRYFAMIVFPQLLALYDEYEEIRNMPECDYNMLVAFKWIVEAAPEFPQISKSEIDGYFRLFKRRLIEHGCSLSIYHMKRCLFYLECDLNIAAADFYRFLDAPLDSISDGRALYYDQQVIYYTRTGNEEKALKAAEPIFSGKMTSNALPQATYHEFIRFYLDRGEYEKALDLASKTLHRVDQDAYYLDIIGTLMTLYGITEPEKALRIFCRNYPVYMQSKNPKMHMKFAIGAYRMFHALPDGYALPDCFAVPKDSPVSAFGRNIAQIKTHFLTEAKDLAKRFDERNGTELNKNMIYYEYPPYHNMTN